MWQGGNSKQWNEDTYQIFAQKLITSSEMPKKLWETFPIGNNLSQYKKQEKGVTYFCESCMIELYSC